LSIENISSNLPDIPLYFAEAVYNIGFALLQDDIHDVGYFAYSDRKFHKYHGKTSPDHPSPWHHWQVGVVFLFMSQLMGLMSKVKENLQVMKEIEGLDDDGQEKNMVIQIPYKSVIEIRQENRLISNMPRFRPLIGKLV
jgi:hypothetical protein